MILSGTAGGARLLRICFLIPGALLAQVGDYSGPALLSRGVGGMGPGAAINFRPFVNLSAIYNTSLVLGRDAGGRLTSGGAEGFEGAAGLYGFHSTQHTTIGLNYRGSIRRYSQAGANGGSEHFLVLGVTHRPSRKVTVSLREGAGTFTWNTGFLGTFGFYDPTFAQIPQNEILDTRTDYCTTMADVTYNYTRRLSFNVGGTGFLVRRRLSSLYGVTGASARGDVAYRVARRSSVGVDYFFSHFAYNKAFGSADIHSVGVNYSSDLSRRWRLGVRAGIISLEALSLGTVDIDPAIAEILGTRKGYRAFHRVDRSPTFTVQLSARFRHAQADVSGSYGASPGNGVYLSSHQRTLTASYSYTGMRHWSLQANTYYSDMRSVGQDIARFETVSAGGGLTRSLARHNLFATFRYDLRRYLSGSDYRRFYHYAAIGVAYSPGSQPLRLW